jgi:hypothetical protein
MVVMNTHYCAPRKMVLPLPRTPPVHVYEISRWSIRGRVKYRYNGHRGHPRSDQRRKEDYLKREIFKTGGGTIGKTSHVGRCERRMRFSAMRYSFRRERTGFSRPFKYAGRLTHWLSGMATTCGFARWERRIRVLTTPSTASLDNKTNFVLFSHWSLTSFNLGRGYGRCASGFDTAPYMSRLRPRTRRPKLSPKWEIFRRSYLHEQSGLSLSAQ